MKLEPDILRRVPSFAELPVSACAALALCFRGKRYAAGDVLFHEGDPAASMFFVAAGELTLTARIGRTRHVARVSAGQLVGEWALIDHSPRSATAEAARTSSIYEIGEDAMETLQRAAPAAGCALVSVAIGGVVRRLRQLDRRIERELDRGGPLG
jgi:CRP-like cAMP-binding protein